MEASALRAQVIHEDDGSVTVAVDRLEWAVNAPSQEAAVRELIQDLRQYAEDHVTRAELYLRAPNRRGHFPYVLQILQAATDERVRRHWLHFIHEEVAARAEAAGLAVVMKACMRSAHRTLRAASRL